MQPTPSHLSPTTAHAIGELCIAGDWACMRGDLASLEAIAEQLAAYASEPFHCELARLTELCGSDLTRATEEWARIKDRVYCSVS